MPPSDDALERFRRLAAKDLLNAYCESKNYAAGGYRADSNMATPEDARDFLRALDADVVTRSEGTFSMPRGNREWVFWEHSKLVDPRPITMWMEPVITIASVARLHLDFGWPKDCLGMQSAKWEFDLTACLPQKLEAEHIAGEVKKTVKELDSLIENMIALRSNMGQDEAVLTQSKRNAYRKLKGLLARRAPIFWAIGPGHVSHVFEVVYPSDREVRLEPASMQRLAYPDSTA